jgi:uncharacterized metal-binding protein YceD (DUF177 family)
MPELITHAPDNPEFARVLELRQLRDLDGYDFDIAPSEPEAAALARLLDARAVRKLRFEGRLTPLPRGGWQLDGRLGATVVQTCVVTLEPVTTRVDQPLSRRFLPEAAAGAAELVISPDEDDEVEPLGDRIDLGLVATEALALALPAYPRKPGVTFGPASADGGAPVIDESELKPFAALAALRGKLDKGS